jgi:hypothetical protein
MFSVKPGRGPSLMGAVMMLVVGLPFSIFWIIQTSKQGAPGFFVFFGVVFLFATVVGAAINFYNATSKDRISQFDITTDKEESDPFDRLARGNSSSVQESQSSAGPEIHLDKKFCPFCGAELHSDYKFCPKCGKLEPENP